MLYMHPTRNGRTAGRMREDGFVNPRMREMMIISKRTATKGLVLVTRSRKSRAMMWICQVRLGITEVGWEGAR